MDNIKHSKYKNTGILFEILVRKITSDIISGKPSPATNILKKYFHNTELGKEYKLYETLFKGTYSSESKADITINTLLETSKKLNKVKIYKERYNLIKELKESYDINELFQIKLPNYKAQAAFSILLETISSKDANPSQIISNKICLIEQLTNNKAPNNINENRNIIEEFKSYDKEIRTLTYYILLEKFNKKYSNLNQNQKHLLKEFIISTDNTYHLRDIFNEEIKKIQSEISSKIELVENQVIKIKLQEVLKGIKPLDRKVNPNNNHLVDLLQYYSLTEELNKIHGKSK
jgi:anion-transporting  ArsA/GET3 family ATPase